MSGPNVSVTGTGVLAVGALAAVAFIAWKATPKVGAALQAVNPFNRDNVFASGVNDLGGAIITDPEGPGKNADGSWSLGGWLFDVTHPGWVDEALGRDTHNRQPDLGRVNTDSPTGGEAYDAMGNRIW